LLSNLLIMLARAGTTLACDNKTLSETWFPTKF
jgi:hypothetical protein